MLGVVVSTFVVVYLLFLLWLWLGWERLQVMQNSLGLACSVVIPVRNEADNIIKLLQDLDNQSFDQEFEVILIDDQSEDNTKELIKKYRPSGSWTKNIIALQESFGKKAAIREGINQAKNEIIISIDGDCRLPSGWLKGMLEYWTSDSQMVVGPVVFESRGSLWSKMLTLEFASLVGSSASTLGWHRPSMCNGANLLFSKSAYQEYLNSSLDLGLASGDDMFLMHSVASRNRKAIRFCKNPEAVVRTPPPKDLKEFVAQRRRWAGKWAGYRDTFTRVLAVFIFLVQLVVTVGLVLAFFGKIGWSLMLNLIIAKVLFEFWYLRQVMLFLGQKTNPVVFLLVQVLYAPYVVITALLGFSGGQQWKNRPIS